MALDSLVTWPFSVVSAQTQEALYLATLVLAQGHLQQL